MPLYNAQNKNRGFSMFETLIIFVIIGILAALVGPSFMGMFNRNKVNDSLAQLRAAMQEAQREAVRKNKSCQVKIDTTDTTITATPGDCLPITRDFCEMRDRSNNNCTQASKVAIKTNLTGTPPSLQFSYKGTTNKLGTIVVYSADGSTTQKGCLVISDGIGLMRTGEYTGSVASGASISSTNCNTSLNTIQ
jgi:Tfp pilus assembly protein FimT